MTKELFTLKESKRYPGLYVKKYLRKVFYDGLWNDELIEARGHVYNADGVLVINPFTKIFNRNEQNTDIALDEECCVVNKVNGFMAAATYVPEVGEVVVSTTGSLDSDYVDYAKDYITYEMRDYIEEYYKKILVDHKRSVPITCLFEIVHPIDPHIIEEVPGAYLIGMRMVSNTYKYFSSYANEEMLDHLAKKYLHCLRPQWYIQDFGDVLEDNKTAKNEGVVCYGQKSNTVLKLKTPYYLTAKACARVKELSKLKMQLVDEEFYPLIEYLKGLDNFSSLEEQARLEIIREYYLKDEKYV